MSLGIAKDSDIECVVEGNDETEMAEKLKAFFAQDL
jgi:phosphotransferase system HPr-like phosphotransfer protein